MKLLATPVFFEDITGLLSEDEQWALEDYLIENPTAGDLIVKGKGLRKIRWGLKGKGKSGGIRVIYHYRVGRHIFFVAVFKKSKQENLTPEQLAVLVSLLEDLKNE